MAVATAVSAVGLVALLALPGTHHAPDGSGGRGGEVVPGADSLHVALESRSEAQRLGPGDRIHYTVDVRNDGDEAVSGAEIVQFLPPTVRYVSGTSGAEPGEGRVTWSRSLEPGARASMRFTGEVTGVRGGGEHPVATVCARPEPGAVLVSCDAAVHRVHAAVPPVWVVTGLAFAASVALCVGGLARHRNTRDLREGEPEARTAPVRADVGAEKAVLGAAREPAGAGTAAAAEGTADRPRIVLETLILHRAAPVPATARGARVSGSDTGENEPGGEHGTARVPDAGARPEAGPRSGSEPVPAGTAHAPAEEPEPVAGPRG
ncbi:DUF11 domain-containing protein [Nocardiopsis sp. RV163]|uniref:DUF11 domain-containing protein n=1 Tax=Nocardiopsis sp. RV163 TaxID=1661388 RepID=UPI00064C3864|nr:DUF11 domain-containing protein [Nocardiopsis sp. RV163]